MANFKENYTTKKSKMSNILFRADSSSTIGTGHIMRDIVLAKRYPNATIIFAVQDLTGNINKRILEAGYSLEILPSNKLEDFLPLVQRFAPELIVLDSYTLDYAYEKALKEQMLADAKLLILDDTYEKHYCDILLNHNIYADAVRYENLVPDFCELQCGAKYTLLREEFYREDKPSQEANKKFTLLLALGGNDTQNLNISTLEILAKCSYIQVVLLTSSANQNLQALKAYVTKNDFVTLLIDSNRVAQLMRGSDFCIITPSVLAIEAYFLEVNFLSIQTAANQDYMAEFLHKNGYLVLQPNELHRLQPQCINFTQLSCETKEMVLTWRNSENISKWMLSSETISLKNHLKYIEMLASKKDRVYFLVKQFKQTLGVIDLTDISQDTATIGLYSNPSLKGVGSTLMNTLLSYAFKELSLTRLRALVYKENIQAISLYKKFHFYELSRDADFISMELHNENR